MVGVVDHPGGQPEQFPLDRRQRIQRQKFFLDWTYLVHAARLARKRREWQKKESASFLKKSLAGQDAKTVANLAQWPFHQQGLKERSFFCRPAARFFFVHKKEDLACLSSRV
jgi:hypothetical protein